MLDEKLIAIVKGALAAGYRHLDTAECEYDKG